MNKQKVIGLLVLLMFGLVILAYPVTSHSHYVEGNDVHNQAHYDTPINPQPPTAAPTQVVTGDPNQVVTGSPNQQMVVTQDGRIVTVDGSTKIVQLRRSVWDSNFWNILTVNHGYGYYGGYYGYNGCGSNCSSHIHTPRCGHNGNFVTYTYPTYYRNTHSTSYKNNNYGHRNDGHNGKSKNKH